MKKQINNKPHFMSVHAVADRYGISVSTVWTWARTGQLPAPVKLSARCSRWDARELDKLDKRRKL